MAEKDFFDEEFNKTVKGQEKTQKTDLDSWYSRPAPVQADVKKSKPLYIVLTCFVLIACIGLGWLLCYLVTELTTSEEEKILAQVIEYLKNNYYEDVDNWTEAIEYSGSALMQKAGDRFSQLMAPQTYYDFLYASDGDTTKESFGISFYIEDMGLYITSIATNSNAYGKLQEGDLVLKLSNVKGDDNQPLVEDGQTINEFFISDYSSATIKMLLNDTHSATFHVLRSNDSEAGYEIKTFDLQRSVIPAVSGNRYGFIEYYFDAEHTNISTTRLGGAAISTYEERCLDQLDELNKLSADTGYIRITQFMYYMSRDINGNVETVTASYEFRQVMELFRELGLKKLVLDLKGNPGGNVAYVGEIAGMLATATGDKLSAEEKKAVTKDDKLLMTYLEMPKPARIRENYYYESSYFRYFNAQGDTCNIVVWTDGGSASGSEMLTGVLLDYGTAVQMGTKTYGKGIAQTYRELPFKGKVKDMDGNTIEFPWAIYFTCARYYSPLGTNIHDVGYTPEQYNNLSSYKELWKATMSYWG